MGDFLQHLVARALDQLPAVRPRPTALFEPVRPAGKAALGMSLDRLDAEAAVDDAADELPPAPPAARPRRPRMWPTDDGDAAPAALPALPSSRLSPPAEPLAPRPPAQAPALDPAPPRVPEPDRTIAVPDAARAPALRPPRAPTKLDDIQPPAAAPAVKLNQPRPDQSAAVAGEAPAQRDREQRNSGQEVVAPPMVTRIVEREAQPARPADRPPHAGLVVAPKIAAPAPAEPVAAPPAATPTINVTIGRIEVRASAPSAPAPRQRAEPPAMSLDEYLRRRSGGGMR